MNVRRFSDYRSLLRENATKLGDLAKAIGVSASQLSQVLAGARELSPEQACRAAAFLQLDELETEYLLALVQLARTSSAPLRRILQGQLKRIATLLAESEERESFEAEGVSVSEADRGVFYSQWYYSAIRLLVSVPEMDTAEKIAARLNLPVAKVREAADFLVRTGLCVKKGGRLALGPSRTYAQRGSPFHGRHHLNWRVKAMEYLPKEQADGISYTAAVTLSREDARRIREILVEATERAEAMIDESPSQSLYCLTLDWFEL